MTDTCSSCFFGRTAPSGSGVDGQLCCAKQAPSAEQLAQAFNGWPWKPVNANGWCGDGADTSTGRCFSATITQLPAPQQVASAPWNLFTPTVTAASGTLTSVTASIYYTILGKTILFAGDILITTNGSAAGNLVMSVPVTMNAHLAGVVFGSSPTFSLVGYPKDTHSVNIFKYDGSYPGADNLNLLINGFYESA